jgi:beta-alanine degradation protein BauB
MMARFFTDPGQSNAFGQEVGMRRLALVAMGVCLAGTTSLAQDPVKANPKIYHVLVDNARVRVLHVIAGPGEKTTLHDHPDNITVLLTDGKITFTGADGKSETMDTKAGTALWSGPQKHAGANPGSAPLEAVVIELKGSAAPTAKLPSSRPNMTRTVLVENPRADAIRATADASFAEEPNTKHDYDQIVIAPGPATFSLEVGGKTKTAWKRGDAVFVGRGEAHQAKNTSGKPVDMIVIAIK